MLETKKPIVWMPKQEADLWEAWMAARTPEERRRTSYYFWNNFSYEGYEEWLEGEDQKIRV